MSLPGLRLPIDVSLLSSTVAEIAPFARAADEAGISRIWAPELQRSATVPLAVAAQATSRIELGTGVALAFTRSPTVLALEALDLDDLSDGRFVLGLGAGVRRLNERWHSTAYDPPVSRMRELVAAVRELMEAFVEQRDARSAGRFYDVQVTGYRRRLRAPRSRVPIWMAAVLPGMCRLAGEVADGFLDHPVTTIAWLREQVRPALSSGAERKDRALPAVAGGLICAIDGDDPRAARRAAACTVGFYASVKTYEPLFAGHGFGGRLAPIRRAFAAQDPDLLEEAVGEEMTDSFAAAGAPEEVLTRAREYEGLVDRLWVTPPHHLQAPTEIGRWQAGILETFARDPG